MRRKTSHQWILKIQADAKSEFDKLPPSNKRTLFRHLQQLLEADLPYNLPFVHMIKAKKFERFRKFRVGDYRVLFILLPGEVKQKAHLFKGTLHIVTIENRKDVYTD